MFHEKKKGAHKKKGDLLGKDRPKNTLREGMAYIWDNRDGLGYRPMGYLKIWD